MKTKHFIILLIIMSMAACKQEPQIPFVVHKDLLHTENDDILKSKQEVLNTLFEIDQWYKLTNKEIFLIKGWDNPDYFIMGLSIIKDNDRIKYVHDEIIPGVKECPYLTAGYKEKILRRYESMKDPGNLGYLMAEHELALEMSRLMVEPLSRFLLYLGYERDLYSDDPDYVPDVPEISEEDAETYYYEMIKMNGNWATLTIDWGIPFSDPPMLYSDYLVFSLKKDNNGKWLLSNIQIFEEREEGRIITFY